MFNGVCGCRSDRLSESTSGGTREQQQVLVIQDKMTYDVKSVLQCHSDARGSFFYLTRPGLSSKEE
jgi:hypothetical protein